MQHRRNGGEVLWGDGRQSLAEGSLGWDPRQRAGAFPSFLGLDFANSERTKVIVMTADVMYNCLVHAFVRMEDVNLLCFDEAHHAKKKHTYARIIKEFYLPQPENSRPKIFGMTASPVDSRAHVIEAAASVYPNLQCPGGAYMLI